MNLESEAASGCQWAYGAVLVQMRSRCLATRRWVSKWNRNERIFLDITVVPHPLQWALGLFKIGKLPAMIEHTGYPTIGVQLDNDVLASALREVGAKLPPMTAVAHG
jgi:hypothetical protein